MSEEKNSKQISLWGDSHANRSVSQVNKKEEMTTDISGQKCLDSLKKSNPSSLLERMCKELLTSKTAWSSDRCKMTWKVKVSKSNVSLYQLQASVLGTKDLESGLWATPNTMDYLPPRSAAGTKKLMEGHRKGRTKPSNLREQVDPETMKMYPTPRTGGGSRPNGKGGKVLEEEVMIEYGLRERGKTLKQMYPTPRASGQEDAETLIKRKGEKAAAQHNLTAHMQMFPTPSASCKMDVVAPPETVKQNSSGWSVTRVGTGTKFGAKLNDVVNKIYNTPTTNDAKNLTFPKSQTNRTSLIGNMIKEGIPKPGGKLNPTFVEFLMGFPENWTKIEQAGSKVSETQSSHKWQESSDSQSKKFYPTPRANEPGRTTKGYGRGLAELIEGKEQREPKKFYRTPTAMDKGDNSFKYAAKILKGKLNRSQSKQPVQKTLSMDVAMEHLKNNQHLIDAYDEKFKRRPQLPPKETFIKYLRENLNKKKLVEDNIIKKTTIDHWLRSDHCFAYPTVEYWNLIKPYLKEIKFDYQMTFEIESDWE